MAFLHCHSCNWQQDDFWDKSYNPCISLLHWNDNLLSPLRDNQFTDDALFLEDNGPISTREVIAREYERKAKIIRNMLIPTYEEWKNLKEKPKCPRCGNINWDID